MLSHGTPSLFLSNLRTPHCFKKKMASWQLFICEQVLFVPHLNAVGVGLALVALVLGAVLALDLLLWVCALVCFGLALAFFGAVLSVIGATGTSGKIIAFGTFAVYSGC